MARMCEPRLGISIQGRMRNLGLSTTRGRFFAIAGNERIRLTPDPKDTTCIVVGRQVVIVISLNHRRNLRPHEIGRL